MKRHGNRLRNPLLDERVFRVTDAAREPCSRELGGNAMHSKPSDDEIPFRLWLVLLRTSDIILRARDKELEPYGISSSQAAVLYTIHSLGQKATVGNISKWLFRMPHTITGILDRMEKLGLVERVPDPERKRVVRVRMTARGKKAYTLSSKREVINRIMSVLSEEEMRNLSSYLKAINIRAREELARESENKIYGSALRSWVP